MRTRINYDLKRWISVCVVLVLLVSIFGPAVYATENDFEEITLALKSSEVDDDYIKLYLHDDVHYITLEDLCRLVRCTQSMNGDKISIVQGFWGAEFDVANQTFNDGYQIVDVRILEISDGIYAVPALMFLSYYKAVAFMKNNTLYCEMSEFTAWEALNINYENTLVDIYELYGGEGNVTLSLTLDILMDFIMGDMSTSDDYLSDAFLQAIKVDLYDYSSVQEYKKDSQDKLYKFLHSDQGVEFVEAVDDVLSVAAEPTQWYIQYYYNALEKSFVSLAYDAYEAGQHADVTHYGKKFYEAFTEKNKTSKAAEKYFDNADYVMLFVSAAADTAQQMKYTNATNNLVYNVMGQENLSYLGISPGEDNDWFTVANRYKNVLGVATTQMEAEAMQYFTDKLCWETLIGTGVSSAAGISGGAWTFSLNFARLFAEHFPLTSSSIDAFEADRRALYLSELQQNVYWIAMNTLQNMQNQWDNPEIYTKYIQALQLYCRTSIAMYENLITMVDEFGQDRDYWRNLFQDRIDMLAVSLYQLTTYQDDNINKCLPLELSSFSSTPKESSLLFTEHVYGTDGKLISLRNHEYNEQGLLQNTTTWTLSTSGISSYWHVSDTISYKYDSRGNMIQKIDCSDYSEVMTDYEYDQSGNLLCTHNRSSGITREYHYDDAGNLIQVIGRDADGTILDHAEYTYDANGNQIRDTDYWYIDGELDYIEERVSEYDDYGRIISTRATDFADDWHLYTYDDRGSLIKEQVRYGDMAFSYLYSYDERDRLISKVFQDVGYEETTTYIYDDDNNVLKETVSGKGYTVYTYGDANAKQSPVEWKQAYLNYVKTELDDVPEDSRFYLADMNGDNVPELYIDFLVYANGRKLYTFNGTNVEEMHLRGWGSLYYIPSKGLILSSSGHHGMYQDDIYRIEDGKIDTIASGYWNDIDYEYYWNDDLVTGELYDENLNAAFDSNVAIYVGYTDSEETKGIIVGPNPYSYNQILSILS